MIVKVGMLLVALLDGWSGMQELLTGGNFSRFLRLNTAQAESGATSVWNDTAPASSVFFGILENGKPYVALPLKLPTQQDFQRRNGSEDAVRVIYPTG